MQRQWLWKPGAEFRRMHREAVTAVRVDMVRFAHSAGYGHSEQELEDRREQNGKLAIGHSVFAAAEVPLVVERPGFSV